MLYRRPGSSARSTSTVSAGSSIFSAVDEPEPDFASGVGAQEDSIERWLSSLGMMQYSDAFVDEGWDDVGAARLMGVSDLMGCGVAKEGHKRRLLAAIADLRAVHSDRSRTTDRRGSATDAIGVGGDAMSVMLGAGFASSPGAGFTLSRRPLPVARSPAAGVHHTPPHPGQMPTPQRVFAPPPPLPGGSFETPTQRRERALRERDEASQRELLGPVAEDRWKSDLLMRACAFA